MTTDTTTTTTTVMPKYLEDAIVHMLVYAQQKIAERKEQGFSTSYKEREIEAIQWLVNRAGVTFRQQVERPRKKREQPRPQPRPVAPLPIRLPETEMRELVTLYRKGCDLDQIAEHF